LTGRKAQNLPISIDCHCQIARRRIAREIAASGRDASVPEPSRDEIFNTGLLLQADCERCCRFKRGKV
jgi:hypothetical protein